MRNFWIYRQRDESGVSGTGCVLEGVIFHTGKVYVCWRSKRPSVGEYDSFEDFKATHIDSHPGNGTLIAWSDTAEPPPIEQAEKV